MIRYSLRCDGGHCFDSWFHDSASFEVQTARGLLACPTCDSPRVTKAIMAPALVARGGSETEPASSGPAAPSAGGDDGEHRRRIRAFRDKVLRETRDVGEAFAREARRIHESDSANERIRGQATLREARDLLEDGIVVLPLPPSPDELN